MYDVEVHGRMLLARAEPSKTLYVYDLAARRWVDELSGVLGFDFSPPGSGSETWLVKDNLLQRYHLTSLTAEATAFASSYTRGLGWINVPDQQFPGRSLVSLAAQEWPAPGNVEDAAWIYNPKTGASRRFTPDIDGQPVTLRSLGLGPDGDVYASSYLSGGLAAYDPDNGAVRNYPSGVGQAESIITHQGRIYLGVYPSANILSFDPSQPFSFGVNPVKHFDLFAHQQDRPFAIEPIDHRIAIGSLPTYGATDGALTIFDTASGDHAVYKGIIPGAGVYALSFDGQSRILYGGAGDQLFAWNVEQAETIWQLSLGMGTISALETTENGNVWGLSSSGWLFELDPKMRATVRSKHLYPGQDWDENVDALLRASRLARDHDGQLAESTLGHLFRIDPATLEVETLSDDAYLLAQDEAGDLYFARGADLYRVPVSREACP